MPNVFQEISKRIVESITMLLDKKLQFRDTGLYIQSSADGQLDIVADTTVALSGAVTADSTLNVTGLTTTAGQILTSVAASGSADIASTTAFLSMSPGGAGVVGRYFLGTPVVGREVVLTQAAAGSANVVLAPGSTFDATNGTAAFNAAAETLKIIGVSATRYVILENIGTVQLLD